MAFRIAEGFLDIGIDQKSATTGLDKLTKKLGQVAKSATIAAAALTAAATAFAVKEAAQAEAVRAKLVAVLRSTGEAAGYSAEQLDKQATALQNLTGIGDEAIIRAQTVLATFTQIGKETFPRATEAVLDLASVLSDDAIPAAGELKSAALQIGKALNDPVLGVTALGRAGIQFTQQQKGMIKALVESNKLLDAQEIILQELEKQFGGVAREIGQTAAGEFGRMKQELADTATIVGKELLPSIRLLMRALSDLAKNDGVIDFLKSATNLSVEWLGVLTRIAETMNLIDKTPKNGGALGNALGGVLKAVKQVARANKIAPIAAPRAASKLDAAGELWKKNADELPRFDELIAENEQKLIDKIAALEGVGPRGNTFSGLDDAFRQFSTQQDDTAEKQLRVLEKQLEETKKTNELTERIAEARGDNAALVLVE